MDNFQKKLILVIIIFGAIALVFVYRNLPNTSTQSNTLRRDAESILNKSKTPDYQDALVKLQRSLSLAEPNTNAEATTQMDLLRAQNNLRVDLSDTQEDSVPDDASFLTLKQIALNANYSLQQRSRAFMYIGDFFLKQYDERVARGVIFTGPLFEDLLINNSVPAGIARIYEKASDGGRGMASLQAAKLYAEELLMNSGLTIDQKRDFFSRAHRQLDLGEQYTEKLESRDITLSNDDLQNYHYTIGSAKRLRANILGRLYFLTANQEYDNKETITNIYKDAFAHLAQEEVFITKKREMITRFDYAQWLYEAYGSLYIAEIAKVLGPLYAQDNERVVRATLDIAFKQEKDSAHNTHYHKRGILELAKIDTRLKKLLIENYGWSETDFATPLLPLLKFDA